MRKKRYLPVGCKEEQIIDKGRHRNIVREMAMHLARDLNGMSCKDLGGFFGSVSSPAITLCCNPFGRRLEEDMESRGRANRVKKQLLII
jgi:hypothetical protein